ncbi:LANO_0A07140g1_1 [Lachancea nothofagi CBS 11611]|uniref:LANO_0A07140g1_1 n=1 Tax=Lachancea nothofagi CBS 11611 TaxID=1266666 RepID=A0A1G4ISI7_9SACH|nr:LANO_0A07140g1_1 [Lachancea nothofagi CBS 11611]
MEPSLPSQNLSDTLSRSVEVLSNLASSIKGNYVLDVVMIERLSALGKQWELVREVLISNFDLRCDSEKILERFELMRKSKNEFYALSQKVLEIELDLISLLDYLEDQIELEPPHEAFCVFIDTFEPCWFGLNNLKSVLISSKYTLETGLEFNEILNDHLSSLGTLIDENAEKCFEIRQHLISAGQGRNSFQSGKRVSSVLSESADTGFSRVPTFSEDSDDFGKFVSIAETMGPLESSMKEVLNSKIQNFGKRNIRDNQFLLDRLQQKYQEVCQKHEALNVVFHLLKEELVDSRWKELFESLNNVVSQDIKEAEIIVSSHRMANDDTGPELQSSNSKRLLSLQRIIEKNFNIVYQALSTSVLEAEVAAQANELASRWLVLRTDIDNLELHDDNIDDELSSDLQSLSLQKTEASGIKSSESQRRTSGVGALLFKRMNIKPVMINNTPKSVEKIKPFFRPSEPLKPIPLNFHRIPKLPKPDDSAGSDINSVSITSTMSTEACFSKLLHKIASFSSQRSQIPVYCGPVVAVANPMGLKLNDPMKVELKSPNQFPGSVEFEKCQLPTMCLHKRFLN